MGAGDYEVIVIGLGGMGSAAAYHLAQRGVRVLGLDARPRLHREGSSHGSSRIIRKAYKEGAEYVPLVLRAYELWRELEAESGQNLLTTTGGLLLSDLEGADAQGMRRSARLFDLACEQMTRTEAEQRWPSLSVPSGMGVLYEPDAGVLAPERCVSAHLDRAAAHGAELHFSTPALRWLATDDEVRVETRDGAFVAQCLVVAAGPWASRVLQGWAPPLRTCRVVNAHFNCREPALSHERFPVFVLDVEEGHFYGIPAFPDAGLKFGRHDQLEGTDPDYVRREVSPEEVGSLHRVLERYLPGAAGGVQSTLTCIYTMTPDRHFILDRHPTNDRVVVGAGFSGHGFKFSSVVGEVLADLATEGTTRHAIDHFSARRPALSPLPGEIS